MHWGIGLWPIVVGIYFLLVGCRVLQINKNPEANELWLRKFGRMAKILGPLIILGGLLQLFGIL